MLAGFAADEEKEGLGVVAIEEVEELWRGGGVGSVIDGEADGVGSSGGGRKLADEGAEETDTGEDGAAADEGENEAEENGSGSPVTGEGEDQHRHGGEDGQDEKHPALAAVVGGRRRDHITQFRERGRRGVRRRTTDPNGAASGRKGRGARRGRVRPL